MGYNTPEDIANRALQHCGIPPSDRISSLTDSTKNAKECALCYHKLRKAELRLSYWKFAIKHAVTRSVTSTMETYVPPTYASGTTYAVGDIVSYTDPVDSTTSYWISNQASNSGNTPTDGDPWQGYFGPVTIDTYDSTISYDTGELIFDSSSNPWISLTTGNTATLAEGSSWHALSGTLQALNLLYPIGSGPSSDDSTRNVFRLPYGFVRSAPQDPKAGAATVLGAPGNLAYEDWLYEGKYIVSGDVGPLILRFVADVTDVTKMDDLFCEGLAARMAYEICDSLTQSISKEQLLTVEYKKAMRDARLANAIESGAIQPALDDYLAVRY